MSTHNEQNAAVAYLFSRTKRGVLELLFRGPDVSFYTNEIVRQVGTGTGAVQKELREITAAGLATRDRKGNMVLYKANPASPVFEELRSMLSKTAAYPALPTPGMNNDRFNVAKERLAGFCRQNHIRKMSLFGTVLRDDFREASGIDVLADFEAGHEPGAFELSDLEDRLSVLAGRKVNLRSAGDMIGFAREEAGLAGVVIYQTDNR